jgi:hypothetical protein
MEMSRLKVKELTSKAGFAVLAVAMTAGRAFAQATSGITGEAGIPLLSGSPSTVINRIVTAFLWVIGLVAIIYLIWGGMMYVTAGGDAEKAGKGRTAITNAIVGIIIIALALIIYRAVVGGLLGGSSGLQEGGI